MLVGESYSGSELYESMTLNIHSVCKSLITSTTNSSIIGLVVFQTLHSRQLIHDLLATETILK